jgi:type IV secretion system protein VirB10
LETAIDSTLQGMTTCLLSVDVFGADGQIVVLPRGTQLVGETRGGLKAGQGRIAVLWQSARRPDGVTVELESPGTDALGRAGVSGSIDRQFGERFGSAVLLSVVDGAIAAGVASQQRGGSQVVVAPSGSEAVMTERLKESQGIQPKLLVAQGTRLAVLVARDIDFGSVRSRSR